MRFFAGLLLVCAATFTGKTLWAGGSGVNIIVVVNQNSTNSVQLGNAYCEQRGVPPQNVLRMTNWAGGAVEWSRANFETCLLNPLLAMVSSRGLTNQADFVLLSMDVPYRVVEGASYNSTTSALFYGFKTNDPPQQGTCSLASTNSYAFAEMPFRLASPDAAPTNSFLAMMLTDNSLAEAVYTLSRGVSGDSSFPTQQVFLAKTTDEFRNVRFTEFDNAILDARIRGYNTLIWTNNIPPSFYTNQLTLLTNSLGLMAGDDKFWLPTNAFVPGVMADNLTSYGGCIAPGDSAGQTTLLAFLHAGAAGSYGTVQEPCARPEKFPNPLNYFYQQRGFSLAECYYQSVQNPFEGLLVGEPLSAPFARAASADWSSLANGTVFSSQPLLSPAFSAATTNLPLDQVDLFVDGKFTLTVTNIPPAAGNLLSVALNGHNVSYTVPANATVGSVVTNLAASLNARSGSTRVQAFPTGDRLELQSLNMNASASSVTLSASAAIGSASRLTTQLTPARPTFLENPATGRLQMAAYNAPAVGNWLKLDFTKTNGTHVVVSVTNTLAGANIATLVSNLVNLVNATAALQSADGALASDFIDYTWASLVAEFMLYARSPGWPASQIQVAFTGSPNLQATPSGTYRLQENLYDLRPRNHLYVSSGLFSLPTSFSLNTALFPDGYHQLTAVAYEGTSVRTQSRVSRTVRFQNTSLTATFTPQLTGTNTTIDLPLQFTVTASGGTISRIELFSTGGSIGVVSNQASAVFTAPSAMLGLGLHPFYALVTDTAGNRYQTQTAWIRLAQPFTLTLSGTPLKLSWPATLGASYDILATTNPASAFQTVTSLVASDAIVEWLIPAPADTATFFRVRLSP